MNWYYLNEASEVVGPLSQSSLEDMANCGALADTTLVCKHGTESWITLAECLGCGPAVKTAPPPVPQRAATTDAASVAGPTAAAPQAASARKPAKRSLLKWVLLGVGVFVLFIGIAVGLGVRKAYRSAMADQLVDQSDQIAFNNSGFQDWEKATSLLKEAVALGNHEAEYKLGSCYFYGRGVTQDPEQAIRLFRRAAEGGHADAQFNLAMCYQNGTGVGRDERETLKWLGLAADQNLPQAQLCLGQLYLFGESVPQDQERGIGLITNAANQGFAQAQYDLGLSYLVGDGVTEDPVQAAKWIILAKCQGLTASDEVIQELQSQLTGEQLDAAEQMATEWQKSAGNP